MNGLFPLLILFQLKHFIADYPFQTPYMLGKFKSGRAWILPLFAHAGVHAEFTYIIVYGVKLSPVLSVQLALLDFVSHAAMDRIKASPDMLGRFKALSSREMGVIKRGPSIPSQILPFQEALRSNTYFWWSLGLDQMVHHMTHYYIIWCMIKGTIL